MSELYDLVTEKGKPFRIVKDLGTRKTGRCGHKRRFLLVEFKTGYTHEYYAESVRRGKIRDYSVPSVLGVGYMAPGWRKRFPKLYVKWTAMLTRCYSKDHESYARYGALGVFVCDRWLHFDKYVTDILAMKNGRKLADGGKFSLDKDLLSDGTPRYAPEVCCILPRSLNSSLPRALVIQYRETVYLSMKEAALDNGLSICQVKRRLEKMPEKGFKLLEGQCRKDALIKVLRERDVL